MISRSPLRILLVTSLLVIAGGQACSKDSTTDGDGDGDMPGDGDGDTGDGGGVTPGDGDGDMPGDGDGDMPGDGDGDTPGDGDGDASTGGAGGFSGDGDMPGGQGGDPSCSDDDGDDVCDDMDTCAAGDDHLDDDADGVPDACDVCPDGHDIDDTDGDSIADGCDLCEGEDDRIDIDANEVPDCFENLLLNRTFDEDVTGWTPETTTVTWTTEDAQGSTTSGSAQVANSSSAGFTRGVSATVNNLPAVGGTQLVTYATQYNIPSGQEAGTFTLRVDYYETNCNSATFESIEAPASIDSWGTVVAHAHVPQTATCMTMRYRLKRAASTVGDDFRVLFDNALLSRCDDFDEDEVCD